MRRYYPTLLVVFGLLAVGALAIFLLQSGASPSLGVSPLLVILAGVLVALAAVGLVGLLFGAVVNGLAQALSDEKAARPTPASAPLTAPAVQKPAPAPVPLSDTRSTAIFFLVVSGVVLAFLTLRALAAGSLPGYPLDRLPDWTSVFVELPGLPVTTALGLAAVAVFALFATVVAGAVLAKAFAFLGRLVQRAESAQPAEAGKSRAAGPAARPAAGSAPKVFLQDTRSVVVFFGATIVLVVAFLALRAQASRAALGFTPFDRLASVTVLTLPGEPVAGWPAAILPGPGDPVLGWQAAVLMSLAVVAGAAVVGVGLARLLAGFTAAQQRLDKAEPAWPSRELQALQQRWQSGAFRLPTRISGMDQVIIALFAVLAGLTIFWVVPGIGGVGVADRTVAATQVAASWTPTPQPGPVVTLAQVVAGLPAGDAAAGEAATKARGCVACHVAADASATLVGPAWLAAQSKDGKGIAEHAAERWGAAGYTGKAGSAQEYLYESIVNPTAFVVPGYQPAMPGNYGTLLGEQELADILAYLAAAK